MNYPELVKMTQKVTSDAAIFEMNEHAAAGINFASGTSGRRSSGTVQ